MSRRYSFESTDEPFQPIYRQEQQLPQYTRNNPEQDSTPATRNSPPAQEQSYTSPPRQSPPRAYISPIQTQNHPSYPPVSYTSPVSRSPPTSPLNHPDSSFNRLQAARRYSRERENVRPLQNYGEPVSPVQSAVPALPLHRDAEGRIWGRELGYTNSAYSNITPGADNYGEHAAGGITGIAMGVADQNARESGMEAMRNTPGYDPNMQHERHDPNNQMQMGHYQDSPAYQQQASQGPFADQYARPAPRQEYSQSSLTPLGAAAFPPGISTPSRSTVSRSPHSFNHDPYADPYSDNPYNREHRYSRNLDPTLTSGFDPNSIEDDGDDGLEYRHHNRGSLMSLGHHSGSDRGVPAAAAGGAAAGGIMGTLGGLVGRSSSGTPQYNPVHNTAYQGPGPNDYELGPGPEKSEWLSKQSSGQKKLKWIVGILCVIVIIGGVVGGVLGGVVFKKKDKTTDIPASAGSGGSASDDTKNNGVLTSNSAEIKKLLNNANLHKVFPGIDYTPMYTQYPDCLSYPASQNNVTRDMAVLSQLSNTVRLYGTDCNQTELVLEAIDNLGLKGTVKVWMGVWQDSNATTNARQLEQMYDIFDKYGSDPFVGVIVGNEVLFRKDMTELALSTVITNVKANLTARDPPITLPVASSDLGDNWTQAFADAVDYVMSNIHPFFAGQQASEAAAWTYTFWNNKDTPLKSMDKQIISETGWPSRGGTDCGAATTCTVGADAGITEMNTFMDTWVCDALTNGTQYFWFEAFDEPWKIKFNEPGKEWEDQWGLMDVNRNLKPGVKIPDCGGKTV